MDSIAYPDITVSTIEWVATGLHYTHDQARRRPGVTQWMVAMVVHRQIGVWYSVDDPGAWRILVFPSLAGMARAREAEGYVIARYLGLTPTVTSEGEGAISHRPYLAVFGGGRLAITKEVDNED